MGKLPKKDCPHCRKAFSNKGVYEHAKYHCKKNKSRQKRTFSKKACPKCKAALHPKHMSTHLWTVHDVPRKSDKRSHSRR
jgi:hypothetical protein